ncbi:MAG TPA: nucleotide exchange factor GrpE [Bryobacteraceae bacterium]|jgi:molecular chaperone GrpE|nr:nucleotide exchange factor GrpE [Bryobacteraceae bacterium]
MDESKPIVDSPETPEGKGEASLESLIAERDSLLAEKADLTDRLLRKQAEFDNFRRRIERERAELIDYSTSEAIRALLPILDDFERALQTESADKGYAKGMELIFQRLSEILGKLGLEPMVSVGQPFDHHLHHAIQREESDAPDQTVLEEYQRGYNFRGKLLRPAMVKVAVEKA